MTRKRSLIVVVGLALTACGGTSSTASTGSGESGSVVDSVAVVDSSSDPETTLPALLDPSTDIEAIESPVVLWFWSPG